MPWFRFYNTFLNDPKVQQLRPEQFKTYVNLLVVANMREERGVISADDVDDLAFTLRMDGDTTLAHLSELIHRGLLIETENGLKPRDWDTQQFASDNSTARVQRHRQRQREQGETFPERFGNVRETDTDADVDAEADGEADADERRDHTHNAGVRGHGGQAGSFPDTLSVPERSSAIPLPEGWWPNGTSRDLMASVLGLTGAAAEAEVDRFQTHFRAKGAVACDWDAKFQGWVLDPLTAKRHARQGRGGERQEEPLTPEQQGRFDSFWAVYPKKTHKRAAEREWARIDPDDDFTRAIVDAVENPADGFTFYPDEDRYIPTATNWLRGERWLDEA